MNRRTAIATLATVTLLAAAVQAGRTDDWRLATTLTVVALLLAVQAHHEHQTTRLRTALVQADRKARATRLQRRADAAPLTLEWCCEQWWLSAGRVHEDDCTTLRQSRSRTP
ncbi:hypothetical protein [Streptomyces sp. NPDC053079]|uniref:hypothetical protein n=1 Tax=Streptomyces sp. NPDC053079 TaxID=3365697 RepID=UPI0037CCFC44